MAFKAIKQDEIFLAVTVSEGKKKICVQVLCWAVGLDEFDDPCSQVAHGPEWKTDGLTNQCSDVSDCQPPFFPKQLPGHHE